jgi:SAM-dependent methyltransferase
MAAETVAIVQAHCTDLLSGDVDPSHYVVGRLRQSRAIDRILVAVPDTPPNQRFADIAKRWRVDLFFGSEYDVIDRVLGAARSVGAGDEAVIARVLLNRFYLDTDLVDRQIGLLRATDSDFVALPYDFDINFGADVFTVACLERAGRLLAAAGRTHERFRPWLYIEDHPEQFKVTTCDDVPAYPASRLEEIRASGLFAERDCGTCSTFTYELIAGALAPSDVVLDIACGTGEGTEILSGRCGRVVGADLAQDVVDEANRRGLPNATFDVQDGRALTYPDGCFTTIVSSNTLEHVDDDEAMLRSFHRVLQPGGRLILETPLLRKRPFNSPLLSSHVREYEKEALVRLIERCGFALEHKYGMNRGIYLDWTRAREAVLLHARKTA